MTCRQSRPIGWLTSGPFRAIEHRMAITLYIAKRHGGGLGPRDVCEGALMRWRFSGDGIEGPARDILDVVEGGGEDMPAGRYRITEAKGKLRPALVWLEEVLGLGAWLVGDRFTTADIYVAECLRYAQGYPTLLAEFPVVAGGLGHCEARPAFKGMLAAQSDRFEIYRGARP